VRANAEALGVAERCRVRRADFRIVLRAEARAGRRYGLLLVDPPYRLLERFLPALASLLAPVAAEGATLVIEAPAGLEVDIGAGPGSVRRYGAAAVHLFELP
jgi:16S rRNA G966 N2-methylase RsmD